MNTPAGSGIRIGSTATATTTTTAIDNPGILPNTLGPAGCGAQAFALAGDGNNRPR